MKIKIKNLIGFSLLLVFSLSGCGKYSVGDAVNREKDRQRETAQTIMKDYHSIEGTYTGEGKYKESAYPITLNIITTLMNKDGNYVPQPTLSGNFNLTYPNRITEDGSALQMSYPLVNTIYDADTSQLVTTLMYSGQQAPSIQVNCKALPHSQIHCMWHSLVTEFDMEFTLTKNP